MKKNETPSRKVFNFLLIFESCQYRNVVTETRVKVKNEKWTQLMMKELQFEYIPPTHYPIKLMNDNINAFLNNI
jgi:hypothetical protein